MKKKFYVWILGVFFFSPLWAWWPFIPMRKPFIILLDAGGSSRTECRTIENNFEQTLTVTIAQQLKQRIAQEMPQLQVHVMGNEREVQGTLQTANLANKIAADFVLSIHCYQENKIKPTVYFYQFSYGQQSVSPNHDRLTFIPFDQAYLQNFKKSEMYGDLLKKTFQIYASQYESKGVYAIPFRPLIGIMSPAIAIEIGLKNKEDWKNYIEPLFVAIQKMVEL